MVVPVRRLPWSHRVLRRGDFGDSVRWLQERLREQGYEVGAVDGKYGFLTEDAVLAFQRDRRLRIDGAAGPQVMAALRGDPPRQRLVHVVKEGEYLSEIAARYGVTPEALRWMNRLSPRARIGPGQRLIVWSSYVLVGLSPRAARPVLERSMSLAAGRASGFVEFGFACSASGALEERLEGTLGEAPEERWDAFLGLRQGDGSELLAALLRKRSRRRLLSEVTGILSHRKVDGVLLDPGPLAYGEGARYQKALVELRRALSGGCLAATVPLPSSGWKALVQEFDYEAAGRLLDLAILPFHRWEFLWRDEQTPLPWNLIEGAVARASRRLPPWRLLLGIPLGACVRRGGVFEELPYRAAVVAGYSKGKRLAPTSGGFLGMSVDGQDGKRTYLTQGRDAMARFLSLAYRYRLAGIYLFPASEEDSRLWGVLQRRIKAMEPSRSRS